MKRNEIVFLVASTLALFALMAGVYLLKSDRNAESNLAFEGEGNKSQKVVRNKPKEAGDACFAAVKEKMQNTNMLYEGSDVLTRDGKTYVLRVRTLDNQSSDNFHRAIFTCEIAEASETWSIIRLEPAG